MEVGPRTIGDLVLPGLAFIDPTLHVSAEADIELAPKNLAPNQFLQDLDQNGSPEAYTLTQGRRQTGDHVYLTDRNKSPSTMTRQSTYPRPLEHSSWVAMQPVILGAPRPRVDNALPRARLGIVALDRVGFSAGTRDAAFTWVGKGGTETEASFPRVPFTVGQGESILWSFAEEPPPGAHLRGLYLSDFVGGPLRLQQYIEADKREHVLYGPYRYNGHQPPDSNQTKVGKARMPRYGARREIRRKRAVLDLQPGLYRFRIAEATPVGWGKPSQRSNLRDIRREHKNEAFWVRLLDPHPETIGFVVIVEFNGINYQLYQSWRPTTLRGSYGLQREVPVYGYINPEKKPHRKFNWTMSEFTFEDEDSSGIPNPESAPEAPVPNPTSISLPRPGKYHGTYAPTYDGEGVASFSARHDTVVTPEAKDAQGNPTGVATHVPQVILPNLANELANAEFGEHDKNGRPLNWFYAAPSGAPAPDFREGVARMQSGLQPTAVPFGPYVDSDILEVNTQEIYTIRGRLRVTDYVGTYNGTTHTGQAYVQILFLETAEDEAGNETVTYIGPHLTCGWLSANGEVFFSKRIGPGADDVPEGTPLPSPATDAYWSNRNQIRLRVAIAGDNRDLTAEVQDLAIHPFDGAPRKFDLPPISSGAPPLPNPSPVIPYASSNLAVVTEPPDYSPLKSGSLPPAIERLTFEGGKTAESQGWRAVDLGPAEHIVETLPDRRTPNLPVTVGMRRTPDPPNGYVYEAVTGGTTHATVVPVWPLGYKAQVQDNTVKWENRGKHTPIEGLWGLRVQHLVGGAVKAQHFWWKNYYAEDGFSLATHLRIRAVQLPSISNKTGHGTQLLWMGTPNNPSTPATLGGSAVCYLALKPSGELRLVTHDKSGKITAYTVTTGITTGTDLDLEVVVQGGGTASASVIVYVGKHDAQRRMAYTVTNLNLTGMLVKQVRFGVLAEEDTRNRWVFHYDEITTSPRGDYTPPAATPPPGTAYQLPDRPFKTAPALLSQNAATAPDSTLYNTKNLLTDNQASVETDTSGFVAGNATIARSTARAHHGAASLSVVALDGTLDSYVTAAVGAGIAPGGTYTLSLWVYSEIARTLVGPALQGIGGTTNYYLAAGNVALAAGWNKITFTITVPSTVDSTTHRLVLRPAGAAGAWLTTVPVYYDEMMVEAGAAATDWAYGRQGKVDWIADFLATRTGVSAKGTWTFTTAPAVATSILQLRNAQGDRLLAEVLWNPDRSLSVRFFDSLGVSTTQVLVAAPGPGVTGVVSGTVHSVELTAEAGESLDGRVHAFHFPPGGSRTYLAYYDAINWEPAVWRAARARVFSVAGAALGQTLVTDNGSETPRDSAYDAPIGQLYLFKHPNIPQDDLGLGGLIQGVKPGQTYTIAWLCRCARSGVVPNFPIEYFLRNVDGDEIRLGSVFGRDLANTSAGTTNADGTALQGAVGTMAWEDRWFSFTVPAGFVELHMRGGVMHTGEFLFQEHGIWTGTFSTPADRDARRTRDRENEGKFIIEVPTDLPIQSQVKLGRNWRGPFAVGEVPAGCELAVRYAESDGFARGAWQTDPALIRPTARTAIEGTLRRLEASIEDALEKKTLTPTVHATQVGVRFYHNQAVLVRADGTPLAGSNFVNGVEDAIQRPNYNVEPATGHARADAITDPIKALRREMTVYFFMAEGWVEFLERCVEDEWIIEAPNLGPQGVTYRIKPFDVVEAGGQMISTSARDAELRRRVVATAVIRGAEVLEQGVMV